MKISNQKKPLRFGEFIAAVYTACGKQKDKRIVRRAVNAHLVEFRGCDRLVILEPGSDNIFSFR